METFLRGGPVWWPQEKEKNRLSQKRRISLGRFPSEPATETKRGIVKHLSLGGNAWNSLLKDGIAYTKSVSNNRGGTRKFSRQKHQQNDKDSEQYKSHFPCGKTFRSLKKPENSENVFFPESPRIFAIPIFLLLFISSNFCKIPRKEPPQLPGSFSAGKKISCYRVDSI
jgi:hypothetical protein